MTWTAEITNDPGQDFRLYVELLENDEYRGRIERRQGQLVMVLYSAETAVPVDWLVRVLASAVEDLK